MYSKEKKLTDYKFKLQLYFFFRPLFFGKNTSNKIFTGITIFNPNRKYALNNGIKLALEICFTNSRTYCLIRFSVVISHLEKL